ncbi:hypothetical protein H5T87_09080 [bacterium]|nr:hypothetical protein [bacterium]
MGKSLKTFPAKDVQIIRDLAKRVAEVAHLPRQEERARIWKKHNSLHRVRPLVLIFPEGSWRELIPWESLDCSDEFTRWIEYDLRMRLYYSDFLQDDSVITDVIASPIYIHSSGWGIATQTTNPEETYGAVRYEPVIKEESDLAKLQKPRLWVDWKATEEHYEKLCDLVGDILRVEKRGPAHFWFAIIDDFATWRGFEQLFLDMIERPHWLHKALNFMTEAWLEMLDFYERENVLSLNNGAHYCGSGGLGFTDELPQPDFDGVHIRTKDLWGHATTQIFAEVSPAMHEEFALQYEGRFLSRFGLASYGCCEPLHKKVDIIFKHIPHLRRLSMSPWVDVAEGAERLGKRAIFSWKPNPAPLFAGEDWDEDFVRGMIRDALEKTRECVVEIIFKDIHTCRNQPQRLRDTVRIAKEEAEKFA